jgi:hypothetical protein
MSHRWATAILAMAMALALSILARPARADDCPEGNLLRHATLVRWLDTGHPTSLSIDGAVVPEGAAWPSQAVLFTSDAASLTFDLGAPRPIGAVYLQADASDAFSLFLSMATTPLLRGRWGGAALIGDRPASRGLIGHGDSMFGGALGLVDPLLLLASFLAVGWAFGWEAMALFALAFGVSGPPRRDGAARDAG